MSFSESRTKNGHDALADRPAHARAAVQGIRVPGEGRLLFWEHGWGFTAEVGAARCVGSVRALLGLPNPPLRDPKLR